MSKLDTWNAMQTPPEIKGKCGYCKYAMLSGNDQPCNDCGDWVNIDKPSRGRHERWEWHNGKDIVQTHRDVR